MKHKRCTISELAYCPYHKADKEKCAIDEGRDHLVLFNNIPALRILVKRKSLIHSDNSPNTSGRRLIIFQILSQSAYNNSYHEPKRKRVYPILPKQQANSSSTPQ